MLNCKLCGQIIYFDDRYVSWITGKKIPLDPFTEGVHDCPEWKPGPRAAAATITCNHCDQEIFFDDESVGKQGVKIPLSKDTGKPHNCPAKPFVKKHYDLRQLPDDYPKNGGKVRRYRRTHYGPDTTYDTSEGSFSHVNRYEWQCTWCKEVYAYRIKAMKCCMD